MRTKFVSAILFLIYSILQFSLSLYPQTNSVNWYSFNPGFNISNSENNETISSIGASFNGIMSNENSKIISGFLAYNSLIVTEVKNEQKNIPTVFKLNQNYPNPFNPSTTITWELPSNNYISLIVYDILGREVATLVDEEKTAGTYHIKFDSKNLASGIYFYRLQAGSYVAVKKMILLR